MYKRPFQTCVPYFILAQSLSPTTWGDDTPVEHIDVYGHHHSQGLQLNSQETSVDRLGLAIIDIPASIEIISKESIARKADYSFLSAVSRATGFATSASPGNGGSGFSARGFEGHGSIIQTYDGSRLYVAAGTVTFPADTWTFEQIDVLRGASSVINGVGAIGATVNYVPKKPSFSAISSELEVAVGSDGLRRVAAGSGGRLTDQVAYRLDAVNHYSAGYVDNAEEERTIIASALAYQPVNDLTVKISFDYADVDAPAYWGTPLIGNKIKKATRTKNYNVSDAIVHYEDLWSRVAIDWAINDYMHFSNESYYINANRHWRNAESYVFKNNKVERSFYIEILHDQKQFGNHADITLNFQLGQLKNRLSLGAEVNQIDFIHTNNSPYSWLDQTRDRVDLIQPEHGYWSDLDKKPTTHDYSTSTQQYAVFMDYYIKILEKLSIISGLRYDTFDYKRHDVSRPDNGDQPYARLEHDYATTNWRIGAVFEPSDTTSFYVQYSKATDSIQSLLTATRTDLKLPAGKQAELGIKQNLFNEKLQYTLALFTIRKSNLLYKYLSVEEQIGKQSSKGVEFDIFLQPIEALDISANIAIYKAKFDQYGDKTHNRPKNIPERTANFWVNWRFVTTWQLSGGVRYVGNRFQNNENTNIMPSFTVYDASLSWKVNEAMQLSLRGKNLTNNLDYTLGNYGNQWILGPGRRIEAGLNYRF